MSDLTKTCWIKTDQSLMTPECLLHEGRLLSEDLIKQINTCKINFRTCPTWLFQQLLEWKFDVYGLIKQELAFDINKLK